MSGEIYVDIEAGGKPRKLFEVTQTPETLSLILRSRTTWAPIGGAGVATIKQHKYSVHATLRSPNNINIIKRFMKLSNNEKTDSIMKTRSLKQTNSYTPLFTEWCSHLVKPQYDVSSWKGTMVSLGSYDPDKKTLVYSVFVGPENRIFIPTSDDDMQSKEIICNEGYRLVVIWSFLNLKSENAGIVVHSSSDPSRVFVGDTPTAPESTSEFFDGIEEPVCVHLYKYARDECRKTAFTNMQNGGMPVELLKIMFDRCRYSTDGH
jgi:hypothetical protein